MFFAKTVIDQGFALKTGYTKRVAAQLPSNLVLSYSYLILYKIQLIFFSQGLYRSRFRFQNWLHKNSGSSAAIKFGVKLI